MKWVSRYLIRPSYVLSGAAMNVVSNPDQLEHFLNLAANVSKEHPVVVSEFIEQAKEIEIDAVAKKGEILPMPFRNMLNLQEFTQVMRPLFFLRRNCMLKPFAESKRIAREIAKALEITGPFNMQFLAKDNDIKVIECNLRASRSFPFVSKVMKLNLIEIATKVMLGIAC